MGTGAPRRDRAHRHDRWPTCRPPLPAGLRRAGVRRQRLAPLRRVVGRRPRAHLKPAPAASGSRRSVACRRRADRLADRALELLEEPATTGWPATSPSSPSRAALRPGRAGRASPSPPAPEYEASTMARACSAGPHASRRTRQERPDPAGVDFTRQPGIHPGAPACQATRPRQVRRPSPSSTTTTTPITATNARPRRRPPR